MQCSWWMSLRASSNTSRTASRTSRRVEFRALGRAAALTDERFAGESEQPAAQVGRRREAPRPLFLFPAVEQAPEIEWRALPSKRYHGRIPELAADVRRARVAPSGEGGLSASAAEEFAAIVTAGKLSGGFELPGAGLVVHVETDLFD